MAFHEDGSSITPSLFGHDAGRIKAGAAHKLKKIFKENTSEITAALSDAEDDAHCAPAVPDAGCSMCPHNARCSLCGGGWFDGTAALDTSVVVESQLTVEQEDKGMPLAAPMVASHQDYYKEGDRQPSWVCPDCDETNRQERPKCNMCQRSAPIPVHAFSIHQIVIYIGPVCRQNGTTIWPKTAFVVVSVGDTELHDHQVLLHRDGMGGCFWTDKVNCGKSEGEVVKSCFLANKGVTNLRQTWDKKGADKSNKQCAESLSCVGCLSESGTELMLPPFPGLCPTCTGILKRKRSHVEITWLQVEGRPRQVRIEYTLPGYHSHLWRRTECCQLRNLSPTIDRRKNSKAYGKAKEQISNSNRARESDHRAANYTTQLVASNLFPGATETQVRKMFSDYGELHGTSGELILLKHHLTNKHNLCQFMSITPHPYSPKPHPAPSFFMI